MIKNDAVRNQLQQDLSALHKSIELYDIETPIRQKIFEQLDIIGELVLTDVPTEKVTPTIKPQQVEQPPVIRKVRSLSGKAIFKPEEKLATYSVLTIYKPIVNYILEHIPDKAQSCDIRNLLIVSYKIHANRTLKDSTAAYYSSYYIKYLIDNRFLQKDEMGRLVKPTKPQKPEVTRHQKTSILKEVFSSGKDAGAQWTESELSELRKGYLKYGLNELLRIRYTMNILMNKSPEQIMEKAKKLGYQTK